MIGLRVQLAVSSYLVLGPADANTKGSSIPTRAWP